MSGLAVTLRAEARVSGLAVTLRAGPALGFA